MLSWRAAPGLPHDQLGQVLEFAEPQRHQPRLKARSGAGRGNPARLPDIFGDVEPRSVATSVPAFTGQFPTRRRLASPPSTRRIFVFKPRAASVSRNLVALGEGYIHDKSLPVLGVANLAVEIGPLTGLFFSVVANNDGSFCAGNIGENSAGVNQETIAEFTRRPWIGVSHQNPMRFWE